MKEVKGVDELQPRNDRADGVEKLQRPKRAEPLIERSQDSVYENVKPEIADSKQATKIVHDCVKEVEESPKHALDALGDIDEERVRALLEE